VVVVGYYGAAAYKAVFFVCGGTDKTISKGARYAVRVVVVGVVLLMLS